MQPVNVMAKPEAISMVHGLVRRENIPVQRPLELMNREERKEKRLNDQTHPHSSVLDDMQTPSRSAKSKIGNLLVFIYSRRVAEIAEEVVLSLSPGILVPKSNNLKKHKFQF